MTIDELNNAIEPLFEVFAPMQPDKRRKGFYRFFGQASKECVESAAKRIAESEEKFPSIPHFGAVLKTITFGSVHKEKKITDCEHCRGEGHITAVDEDGSPWAYRCKCVNASAFQNYPQWFGITHKGKRVTTNAYEDIKNNPEKYKKGLAYLKSNGIKIPDSVSKKIELALLNAVDEDTPPF